MEVVKVLTDVQVQMSLGELRALQAITRSLRAAEQGGAIRLTPTEDTELSSANEDITMILESIDNG